MKAKKMQVIRPEMELAVNKPLGWFLIPFYALYVYVKTCRVFRFPVHIGNRKVMNHYVLSVPKVKMSDAS